MNRFHKSTDRGLLVTDKYVYKLEPKKQNKVLKRLPLDAVSTHTGETQSVFNLKLELRLTESSSI